ncbi:nucleotide exchange factor GrpE [Neptunomonas antarctica]|uniref:Protein GrpE n=1 Tax=Neptunomonas antarctica TaxID=619304 RepID=A0A1N7J638_9GAMM|nr:nucleotide exchange factor GrpE [Neptunomonas antarctica]SIS44782.1 molecular chaperone GrpE [Neptunomonas antarctica]
MANDQTTQNEQVLPADVDETILEGELVGTEDETASDDAGKVAPESAENEDVASDTGEKSESTVNALGKQLAAAQEEIVTLKEQTLRVAADMQNNRRRADKDVENARKFALEKFVNEMLPIIDSLERTLDACNVEDEATKVLRDGVEMTHSMFVAGLAKFNVEQLNPQGEVFDPVYHQAMSLVDAPDAKPNTVIAVMQKGYNLNGRLIRPAMVMVSKS